MSENIRRAAQAELLAIEFDLSFLDRTMAVKRKKPQKIYLHIPGKGDFEINDLFEKRRVALRRWLRKWGKKLKESGFRVVGDERTVTSLLCLDPSYAPGEWEADELSAPTFFIASAIVSEGEKPDEVFENAKNEKYKNVFDPNSMNITDLRKPLKE